MPLGSDVDLNQIAKQTAGLTGADLANIANEAAIFAGRKAQQYIRQTDFDGALERVTAGLQQRRVVTDKEKRILAYHEAGHALMAHLMGELMPTQKVTIVGRGDVARLRVLPSHRGALPPHQGGVDRRDEGRARRPGRRTGRVRPRHERRRRTTSRR